MKNVPCYVQAKHKHVRSRNVTKMELFLNRIFLLIIIIKCRHRFVGFVFLFLFFLATLLLLQLHNITTTINDSNHRGPLRSVLFQFSQYDNNSRHLSSVTINCFTAMISTQLWLPPSSLKGSASVDWKSSNHLFYHH